jgi:hypothetical protein
MLQDRLEAKGAAGPALRHSSNRGEVVIAKGVCLGVRTVRRGGVGGTGAPIPPPTARHPPPATCYPPTLTFAAMARPSSPPPACLLQEPGSTVLVAGATGGVGQLLTAKLLDVSAPPSAVLLLASAANPRAAKQQAAHASHPPHPGPTLARVQRGYKVRALARSAEKVAQLFGGADGLSVSLADLRDPSTLPAALEGVDAVCCCTGTTAFPSKRCGCRGGKGEGLRHIFVLACWPQLKHVWDCGDHCHCLLPTSPAPPALQQPTHRLPPRLLLLPLPTPASLPAGGTATTARSRRILCLCATWCGPAPKT